MARKNRKLAVIPVKWGWHSDDQLYMHCEQLLNDWLRSNSAGRWCKSHATDLTFKPVVQQAGLRPGCDLIISGRLEETDYSYYLLCFGGENK